MPAFTVEVSAASLLLTREVAASATIYPVNAFLDAFVSPLVRVGYRNERFLPYADHVLGALAPSFHSMTSAAQLSVDGLSFHAIAVELGISFVTTNGTIFEATAGRIFQIRSSYGSNPRDGVVFTGARLPAACLSVGKLFGHRNRSR